MRNLEEFNGRHKGELIFIIGAGPSLFGQNLDKVKNYPTISVNSGYVAAPWSSYFVSDDWSVKHWSYFFRELKESDTTTVFLYEDKLKETSSWFGSRSVLFKHRKGLHIPDKYEHLNRLNHLGQTRTSLGTAIMIAHIMGCARIVLLGVDGCRYKGKRYFWQFWDESKQPFRNDDIPIERYQYQKFGEKETDNDLLDIESTWQSLGKAINRKCVVYNVSPMSIIKVFPKIALEDCFG